MTSPQISDLAASFRRSLRAAGKAERTLVIYAQSIRFFSEWLVDQGRPVTLDQLNRHAISAWLAHLLEAGQQASTVATRLRGLRRFCRWLEAEGEVDKAPTAGVEIPAIKDKPVRVLTDEELAKLIKACEVPRGKSGTYSRSIFDGRRDETMVRLLADCGLRVSELVGITLDDIDLEREVVFVMGKGSHPRAVPYGARTAQCIDRYLRIRSAHAYGSRTNKLILSERGPMSTDGVRWRLEALGAKAGVEGLHPHALRHTFAHRWLASGGQERDLMHLAGWRSDSMLQVYARSTAIERAHDAHRRMGLGDKL